MDSKDNIVSSCYDHYISLTGPNIYDLHITIAFSFSGEFIS